MGNLHTFRKKSVSCLKLNTRFKRNFSRSQLCLGKFVPGCYEFTVTGELSEEMQVLPVPQFRFFCFIYIFLCACRYSHTFDIEWLVSSYTFDHLCRLSALIITSGMCHGLRIVIIYISFGRSGETHFLTT